MKTLKVAIIVSFLIVIFASVSIASAATTTISATGTLFWSEAPSPGKAVEVTINFQSASSLQLSLYRIGIHADWQESGQYYTKDLSSDPQIVEANGIYPTKVTITIPATASVGAHTFKIAVDGFDADGNQFNWDSADQTVNVVSPGSTTDPNSGPTGSPDNPSNGAIDPLIIYIAVIAVVAVAAVLVAILVVKRKSKPNATSAAPYAPEPDSNPPPETPKPEDKSPADKPNEKDFTI